MQNSVCRICRKEGKKLFLKGERCFTPKCAIVKRPYGPGKSGSSRGHKLSDFGKQLRAKQSVKAIYGIMEKQFKNYYQKAAKSSGKTGDILLTLLETRLDNIIYRLGYAASPSQAKQIVSHKHVLVDEKTVNIPSYNVSVGEIIKVKDGKQIKKTDIPVWIKFDSKSHSAKIEKMPERQDLPGEIDEQSIVEFYSR